MTHRSNHLTIQVSQVNPSEQQEMTRYYYYQGTVFVVSPSATLSKPSSTLSILTTTSSSTIPTIMYPLNPMVSTKQEFVNAMIWNKYASPTDEQHIEFVNRMNADTFSSKREVAMFSAHMTYESGELTVRAEEGCTKNGCKGDYQERVQGRLPRTGASIPPR